MMEYEDFDRGENTLASASDSKSNVPPPPQVPKEVFPVSFDKDFMDLRPQSVDEVVEYPKGLSAPVSADTSNFVTGMEDVSVEDLEENVTPSAEKELKQTTTMPIVSGKPVSSEATSPGKKTRPARK